MKVKQRRGKDEKRLQQCGNDYVTLAEMCFQKLLVDSE